MAGGAILGGVGGGGGGGKICAFSVIQFRRRGRGGKVGTDQETDI